MTEGDFQIFSGPLRTVFVEAPAGYGKTWQAARLAARVAESLHQSENVLFLAHTNAAVNEFRARAAQSGIRSHASTIDSFALEVIRPYARALGFPTWVGDKGLSKDELSRLSPALLDLLSRCPSIARLLGRRFPVVILDEHQDSRAEQHDAIEKMAAAGESRVRILGDPLQGIYEFGDHGLVNWEAVKTQADASVSLNSPWRWNQANPQLGAWMGQVRSDLLSGRPIPCGDASAGITVVHLKAAKDSPPPKSRVVNNEVCNAISQILKKCVGSVGILTRSNDNVVGLKLGLKNQVIHLEGAENALSLATLTSVVELGEQPQAQAQCVLAAIAACSSGLDKLTRAGLEKCLKAHSCDICGPKRSRQLASILSEVYAEPGVRGVGRALTKFVASPPEGMYVHSPEALKQLAWVGQDPSGLDPLEALEACARRRRLRMSLPNRCVSTIHKAKGRSFDNVILSVCGKSMLKDDLASRRLLYVALTRATTKVWLIVPSQNVSPLLRLTN